ncbi:MAPEG family protein [Shewanella sp. GXUN23E]|uniref:MAPEG family protein n=1 Tax=Shewanella sp. GXUN23E TaxID=3422498 RepID=UPI003D7D8DD3
MTLVITAIVASLTALMAIYFSWRVIKVRRAVRIGLGTDGNKALQIADRVHGNLLENAPVTLLLMLLAELAGLPMPYLVLLGMLWLLARVMHAVGLIRGEGGYHPGRFWGVLLTWGVIICLALVNLALAVAQLVG